MKHSRPLHTAETEIRRLKDELHDANKLIAIQHVNSIGWQEHAARRDEEAEQAAVEHGQLSEQVRALAGQCARYQHQIRLLEAELVARAPRIAWPPRGAPMVPPMAPLRLAHPDIREAS